jgi:hypothetical protein
LRNAIARFSIRLTEEGYFIGRRFPLLLKLLGRTQHIDGQLAFDALRTTSASSRSCSLSKRCAAADATAIITHVAAFAAVAAPATHPTIMTSIVVVNVVAINVVAINVFARISFKEFSYTTTPQGVIDLY